MVCFKFKESAKKSEIERVEKEFTALKDKIPGILSLEWGKNNSPENLNALSEKMISLIQKNIDKAAYNKNVRVIIISSEGTTFSSGHDLKELKKARINTDKGKRYYLKILPTEILELVM